MSERPLNLLLIDDDPIFRIGLRAVCEQFPDLQVVAEAKEGAEALDRLEECLRPEKIQGDRPAATAAQTPSVRGVDLVILELGLGFSELNRITGLSLCERLKTHYPQVPVLLLSSLTEPALLAAARQAGVRGYCPKGCTTAELIRAIRLVAGGQTYWSEIKNQRSAVLRPPPVEQELTNSTAEPTNLRAKANSPLAAWRRNLRLSGLRQIDALIEELTAQLQKPNQLALDRVFLEGRLREVRTARWLVNQLLLLRDAPPAAQSPTFNDEPLNPESSQLEGLPEDSGQASLQPLEIDPEAGRLQSQTTGSEISFRALQSELFEATLAKLNSNLPNLTNIALEIDILRQEKKRELLSIILRLLEEMLDELRFSQVQLSQLSEKRLAIVRDLWEIVMTEFFGKYYTLFLNEGEVEVVPVFLQEAEVVQSAILDKIPQVRELLGYMLFHTPVMIDNIAYPAGSPEAMLRAGALLENLVIQVGNAALQPLLNYFADVEAIKQGFYDRRWISTRSIEKFRNNLSWKYRLEKYFGEPTAIFESRYWLLILDYRGITKIPMYAPRREELMQLSGIPLAVTLVLESRDAVAPRLRSAVGFVGTGVVYVLTQVIGRGIGLIGRGIIQGIGSSWQESKFRKSSQRQK